MGGFSSSIAHLATDVIEGAGKKIAGAFNNPVIAVQAKHAAENVEAGLYHKIFKPEAAFADSPVTAKLWKAYSGPYHELTSKYESEATNIAAGKVPAAGKHTSIAVNMDHREIRSHARKLASEEVFGPHREVIQGVLKHLENTGNTNKANIIADHFNVLFQEVPMQGGGAAGLSSFDTDMRKGSILSGRAFETHPTQYRGRNTLERIANWHQRTLAYKAAIPHLTSNLNIMLSDGFGVYAKSLAQTFGPGRKAAEAQVLATNAIGEMAMNGYREKQMFDKGIIKQFAPGSVGEFIHRNILIPGMNSVRYNTLLMSAHASKLAGEEAAYFLVNGNTKRALPVLKELGLDPAKIAAQKGQLLPEDIAKAYYYGTNSRAFLQQRDNRTIMGQQSPLWRTIGAFHSYVSSQANFIRKTFMRQYAAGDFAGIARNIALMGVAFPIAGATIYESERLLTGNDWDDPAQHYEDQIHGSLDGYIYDAIRGEAHGKSAAKSAVNTIDLLSHLASFGVATGYIRGATRSHLANQIIGPDANMIVQGAEDTLKATHTDANHPDAWKALARDFMQDTPSLGLGSMASHKLLPTKKEESVGKYYRFKRKKAKVQTYNPFND